MGSVWCRSCSLTHGTHSVAQATRTGAPLSQDHHGFLFTPTVPRTCAVTYPESAKVHPGVKVSHTGAKVQSQHSRPGWVCYWFLFSSSEIQLKLAELCAFATLEKKAFWTVLSPNAPLLGEGAIPFVCAGVLDEGLQKVLATKNHLQEPSCPLHTQ